MLSFLKQSTEPNTNDVLCGRGGKINGHNGNIQFRAMVEQRKVRYFSANTMAEKALITREIVDCIAAMDPPGRFLNKDKDSGFWYEENKMNALKKTSQALREGAARAKAKAAMMKTQPPPKEEQRCSFESSPQLKVAEEEQTQCRCVTIDLCNEGSRECTNTVNDNVRKTEKLLSTPAKKRFSKRHSLDLACDFSSIIGLDEPACNPFVTELSDMYPYARPFECISDSNINAKEGSSNELYIRDYELVQKIMDYDRFRVRYEYDHMTRSEFWSK